MFFVCVLLGLSCTPTLRLQKKSAENGPISWISGSNGKKKSFWASKIVFFASYWGSHVPPYNCRKKCRKRPDFMDFRVGGQKKCSGPEKKLFCVLLGPSRAPPYDCKQKYRKRTDFMDLRVRRQKTIFWPRKFCWQLHPRTVVYPSPTAGGKRAKNNVISL